MKAPIKIYLHKGELRTPFALETSVSNEDVEYIKKSDIIKWLERQKEMLEFGGRLSIDDLIEDVKNM